MPALPERLESTVLIVGGGPVGLSCAMDLAQRGIDCILVERTDGVVRLSKMGLVSRASAQVASVPQHAR